jgi:hypothetical protein
MTNTAEQFFFFIIQHYYLVIIGIFYDVFLKKHLIFYLHVAIALYI